MTARTTLEPGCPAPDFTLRDQHGQEVTLSGFAGSRAVVLVFYPWAFSRVCTGELHDLRDRQDELAGEDVQLLAVSCDPMFSLRAFADADGLDFPLLSDFWPHGAVASAYGVLDAERGCPTRSTFIIDRDGVVRWSVHNALGEARNVDAYLEVLADLGDRGTPAK